MLSTQCRLAIDLGDLLRADLRRAGHPGGALGGQGRALAERHPRRGRLAEVEQLDRQLHRAAGRRRQAGDDTGGADQPPTPALPPSDDEKIARLGDRRAAVAAPENAAGLPKYPDPNDDG